ncbi:hypothetical protein EON65_50150 [archaeon]|nr:MAG: hypothetical protein EON65_50150 [archaeon]
MEATANLIDAMELVPSTEDYHPEREDKEKTEEDNAEAQQKEPFKKDALLWNTVETLSSLFAYPWFCRGYFLFHSIMEVFDVVSDWLWLVSLSLYSTYSQHHDDEEATRFFNRLFVASLFIAVVSMILIGSKFFDDLRGISDKSREYLKTEIPGFSAFYIALATDEQILVWQQQRKQERQKTRTSVLDALVGIHREDNYLDRPLYPIVKYLMVGSMDAKNCPVNCVWEGAFYPLRLLFSSYFCSRLGCLAVLLFPFCGFVTVFMSSMWLLIVGMNFCFRSHHVYTIRIIEDVPQFAINIVYLTSKYAGSLDAFSIFSLICSGTLLAKSLCEMAWWWYTSKSVSKLSQRRIVLSEEHTGLQVVYITFFAPMAVHTVVLIVYGSYVLLDSFMLPTVRAISKACQACRRTK